MMTKKSNERTVPCPYCGADIRADAKACPRCGSDENTGWSDERYLDGIDLPEEGEYEELLNKEFGTKRSGTPLTWIAAIGGILLLVFLLGLLR
jgi:uncharacterized membrane protein YvbJ